MQVLKTITLPTSSVRGILCDNQRSMGEPIFFFAYQGLNFGSLHRWRLAEYESGGCKCITRYTTTFVIVHMRVFMTNDLIARSGVNLNGNLISHCTRRAKQSRLMAKQGCRFLL